MRVLRGLKMDKLIKIGDFSKINRVSVPTLRLYDELGILKPIYVDKDSFLKSFSGGFLTLLKLSCI